MPFCPGYLPGATFLCCVTRSSFLSVTTNVIYQTSGNFAPSFWGGALVAERTSYFCLACKLIWPLWSSHIFTKWEWLMPFSPGQHKKAVLTISRPLFSLLPLIAAWTDQPWESTHPLSSPPSSRTEHKLSSLFHAGITSRTDLSTWQSIHSLSSLASSRKDQPTWETTFTLLHRLSLTYFEESAKHHEEILSNLCTVGVWEIILSSFILPSKPTDPRRNKLDIFNFCF